MNLELCVIEARFFSRPLEADSFRMTGGRVRLFARRRRTKSLSSHERGHIRFIPGVLPASSFPSTTPSRSLSLRHAQDRL